MFLMFGNIDMCPLLGCVWGVLIEIALLAIIGYNYIFFVKC